MTGLSQSIFRNSPALLAALDDRLVCRHVSQGWRKRLELADTETCSIPLTDMFSLEDKTSFQEQLEDVLNNGAVLHEQPVSLIETGAITEGLLSVWRVQQNNEQPWLLMTATCSDELNEALDELRRLRTTHQLILNAAGEGIYGLDNEGRTTFGNAATMEILGWNPENIIGKKAHDVHHHSHPDGSPYPRTECPIYAALKDGEVHRVDNEVFWHTDGSAVPVEYTSTPIWQDGKINGAVVVFRDISERKEIERQREVEKANMLAALRHVDGRIWGSDGAAALLGLKPSTLTYRMKVFGIRNEDRAS